MWNIASGQATHTLNDTNIWQLAFSPARRLLASLGQGDDIKLWDVTTGQEVLALKGPFSSRSIVFSSDGKRLASVGLGPRGPTQVKLWDVATGQPVPLVLKGETGHSICMAFSPDGNRLALESGTSIKVWDIASGEVVLALRGHFSGVKLLSFSPDGKRLASAGFHDKAIKMWDVTPTARSK